MKKDLMAFIKQHRILKPHATILIGVSGGPDSMALLHFYLSIQKEWKLKLVVLSIDHQLRGEESSRDLQYVKDFCSKWQIEMVAKSIDVKAYKKENRIGTQVAARNVRYTFFKEQMVYYNADFLALGHHGDDQVETMLMGFVRSTSTMALSGIPVKRKFSTGYIIRPLLAVSKDQIITYCETHQLTPRIDPSNEDTDYTRNYFRKFVIPQLKGKNNNIHITTQRLSEALQADESFLQNEAQKMKSEVVTFNESNKKASFKKEDFKKYPYALQRRAYHLILNCLYNKQPSSLTYAHEDIFFELLEDKQKNVQINFPSHLIVEVSYNKITFSFSKENKPVAYEKTIQIPEKLRLPNGSTITASYMEDLVDEGIHTYACVVDEVHLPLHVRTRRPGDRMSWQGLMGSKKIKDIFIDEKIPRKKRDSWPIVTDNKGDILWLVGLRKGNQKINPDKQSIYIQLIYDENSIQEDGNA